MRIDQSTLAILDNCRVEGSLVSLPPGQLERKQYEAVNKVLELLGGKWNKKARAHAFTDEPAERLDTAILTEDIIDMKKQLQFFETPEWLADEMVAAAGIVPGDIVMEPSAGKGRIVSAIRRARSSGVAIIAVELSQENCHALEQLDIDVVHAGDFLAFPRRTVQRIIMNPPFRSQQDAIHINHAWNSVAKGGTLVAIASEGAFTRTTSHSVAFQSLVDTYGASKPLPQDTFKESGANVRTRILTLRRPA